MPAPTAAARHANPLLDAAVVEWIVAFGGGCCRNDCAGGES
jgi:hypothetical protein